MLTGILLFIDNSMSSIYLKKIVIYSSSWFVLNFYASDFIQQSTYEIKNKFKYLQKVNKFITN